MDISVLAPISLKMNIISTEEKYPSIEIGVNIECIYGSTKLFFQDVIWIEQYIWDSFVGELVSARSLSEIGEHTKLKLFDMSDRFRMEIFHCECIPIFSISFGRDNESQIKFSIRYQIDSDVFGHICRSFGKL